MTTLLDGSSVRLAQSAWFFGAAWLVHTGDHARRGIPATTETVVWAGTAVGLLAAISITLIAVKHPTAPAIASAIFPAIALGVLASHMLPRWSALSDPLLVDSSTDGWSILAATTEIVASTVVGLIAFRILRRNGYAWQIEQAAWS